MNNTKMAAARRLGLAGAVAATALAGGWALAGPAYAVQSPAADVADDILTITGTGDADRIALRLQAGAPTVLEVDFDDNGTADFTFDRGTFTRVVVFALGGDDQFRVDGGNGDFTDEALTDRRRTRRRHPERRPRRRGLLRPGRQRHRRRQPGRRHRDHGFR